MPFANTRNTTYFYFENLKAAGLVHGIFARHGGVSPAPWSSLNTGSRVGDSPENVGENLARAARALSRAPGTLVGVRQVHGNSVHRVDGLPPPDTYVNQFAAFDSPEAASLPEADAMVTRNPDATLFMRFADCVPILVFDPAKRVVAMAHAGWRGTVKLVAARTVESMAQHFGSEPAELLAGIGPSICVHHYEVGQDVVDEARSAFGDEADKVVRFSEGRRYFDLREANRIILVNAGVRQVEMSASCTLEAPDLWYSHRGEKGQTGRFAAMAGM